MEMLTEIVSRSDQGMWSPPPKKAPTESKKVPILASIGFSLLFTSLYASNNNLLRKTDCGGPVAVVVETT